MTKRSRSSDSYLRQGDNEPSAALVVTGLLGHNFLGEVPRYQQQVIRTVIEQGDVDARVALASDPRTLPEILFFLVKDPDARVRRAVAENPATPIKAGPLLARDDDIGVRCALARKVVGDGLAAEERRNMWRMGFTILETLARDQIVRVRRVLAEAFQSPPDAPREIVLGLARDTAQSNNAQQELKRYADLIKRGIATQEQYDTAHTNVASYDAAMRADQAPIDNAKLQLAGRAAGGCEFLADGEIDKAGGRLELPVAINRAWEYWGRRCGMIPA